MPPKQTTPKQARTNYKSKKQDLQDGLLNYIESKILSTFPFYMSTTIKIDVPTQYHAVLEDFYDNVINKYTNAGWDVQYNKTSNGSPVFTLTAKDRTEPT